jgi:hypothetical protein
MKRRCAGKLVRRSLYSPVPHVTRRVIRLVTNPHLVKRFATDVVGPKVRDMDENETMDPSVIKGLFQEGVSPQAHLCVKDH